MPKPIPQASMSYKPDRMTLHERDGYTVMDLGAMDIWDGADLALLRETLLHLLEIRRCRGIGVDMTHVKYIPSGFFGMLYDCLEKGVAVRLYTPQANVARMLWFQQFFGHLGGGTYQLQREPKDDLGGRGGPRWERDDWAGDEESATVAAATRD
ncbi:MAG: hypothetical protein ACREJB_10970 [Planctomycetaceae bacterium]